MSNFPQNYDTQWHTMPYNVIQVQINQWHTRLKAERGRVLHIFEIWSLEYWSKHEKFVLPEFYSVCHGPAAARLWDIPANIFANLFNRSKWNIWENGKFPEAEQQEIFQRIFWLNESIHNLGTLNEKASRGKWEVSDMLH